MPPIPLHPTLFETLLVLDLNTSLVPKRLVKKGIKGFHAYRILSIKLKFKDTFYLELECDPAKPYMFIPAERHRGHSPTACNAAQPDHFTNPKKSGQCLEKDSQTLNIICLSYNVFHKCRLHIAKLNSIFNFNFNLN